MEPFDDIANLLADFAPLASPTGIGPLIKGDLGSHFMALAALRGRNPAFVRPFVCLFAASHAYDLGQDGASRALMAALAENEGHNGAPAANFPFAQSLLALAKKNGAALKIYDLALGVADGHYGTTDSLDDKACVATMAYGMEVLAEGPDCLILSDIDGAANRAALSLLAALLGQVAGGEYGDEINAAVARATGLYGRDSLKLCASLGGREIAAMAGSMIAARAQGVPVIIDGLAGLAAALTLVRQNPQFAQGIFLAATPESDLAAKAVQELALRPLIAGSLAPAPMMGILALGLLASVAHIGDGGR